MVRFEPGKEIEKYVFFVLSWVWDKVKNSKSPWGIEPQIFRMPHSDALPLSHSDSKVSEIHYEVHIEHASCVSAYHLSQSIYKHDAIDIADLSSMQDACYVWTSYWTSLTVESLSGRASKRRTRRSDFFLFVSRLWQDKKHHS